MATPLASMVASKCSDNLLLFVRLVATQHKVMNDRSIGGSAWKSGNEFPIPNPSAGDSQWKQLLARSCQLSSMVSCPSAGVSR